MPMPAPVPTTSAISAGRLLTPEGVELPLVGASIRATAGGGHARVELTQVFVNDRSSVLDVTYKVPLPADGAVSGYRFQLGTVVVKGEVHRKAEARERFEEAILVGKTAALLEEERSSLFTQSLANLPAGARMEVTLTIDQPLAWREDGAWEWRFPTVVAPRFLGDLPPAAAKALQVDVLKGDLQARFSCSLAVTDDLTGAATSPSHVLQAEGASVEISGAELDRDVVVRWPVAGAEPGVTMRVARPPTEVGNPDDPGAVAYARLNLVPPKSAPSRGVARDLVFLVDVSGSMAGEPLRQARDVLDAVLQGLGPDDQVEIVKFAGSVTRFKPGPVAMTPDNRAEARRWVAKLRAGGCTDMFAGIREALRATPRKGSQRQLLLVTDGYIGDESRIVRKTLEERPRATRVHTLGVGSAVNRTLTETVARAGGGLELIIAPGEPATDAARMLLARTERPLVVDLEISGNALVDGLPFCLPDLFAGSPAVVFARVEPTGGTLHLKGRGPDGAWEHTLEVEPLEPGTGEASIPTCWARQRVADLELSALGGQSSSIVESAITKLGLSFSIATQHTSWLAVTQARTVDTMAPKRSVEQPHSAPADVSIEAFGLRGPGVDFASFEDDLLGESASLDLSFDEADAYAERSARSAAFFSRDAPTRAPGSRAPASRGAAAPPSTPVPQAVHPSFADDEEPTGAFEPQAAEPRRAMLPPASYEESGGSLRKAGFPLALMLVALLTLPLWGPFWVVWWLFTKIRGTADGE